ncbi:MAG: ATP-binding protein, partial [Gammaproteobacteria bacterium]
AGRMQHIVTDLLMLSRLEMNHKIHNEQIVAVPGLLAGIVQDACELSKERGHSITLDADPTLELYGNEEELRSAFSNLVFNAVQYTPAHGEIAIRWFRGPEGAHMVVRDTGVGIAAHHIPRLTERFYRVDAGRSRESGGTGLGLAIVKHVLNRHAAQLRIESEPGKGSTFSCDFSASAIALPAAAPES